MTTEQLTAIQNQACDLLTDSITAKIKGVWTDDDHKKVVDLVANINNLLKQRLMEWVGA